MNAQYAPFFILRGHGDSVNVVRIFRDAIVSGDVSGIIIVWSTSTLRPLIQWKAHSDSVLGIEQWHPGILISQGRDNAICAWDLGPADCPHSKSPTLLRKFPIDSLHFCALAVCSNPYVGTADDDDGNDPNKQTVDKTLRSVLVAIPGIKKKENVLLLSLPEWRIIKDDISVDIPKEASSSSLPSISKIGIVMALALWSTEQAIGLIVGYENGHIAVFKQQNSISSSFIMISLLKAHEQPVLSITLSLNDKIAVSTAADSRLVTQHLDAFNISKQSEDNNCDDCGNHDEISTEQEGQQSAHYNADFSILATAGWDGIIRLYKAKNLSEPHIALRWHKQTVNSIGFAQDQCCFDANNQRGNQYSASNSSDRLSLRSAALREDVAVREQWLAAGSKDCKITLWKTRTCADKFNAKGSMRSY